MKTETKEVYGYDALGNEVFKGDTILIYENEFFLKEALKPDAMDLLQQVGAEEKKA